MSPFGSSRSSTCSNIITPTNNSSSKNRRRRPSATIRHEACSPATAAAEDVTYRGRRESGRSRCGVSSKTVTTSLLLMGTLAALTQGFMLQTPGSTGSSLIRSSIGGENRVRGSQIKRWAGVLSKLDFKPAVDVYAKFPEQHQHHHQSAEEVTTILDPTAVKLSLTGAEPNRTYIFTLYFYLSNLPAKNSATFDILFFFFVTHSCGPVQAGKEGFGSFLGQHQGSGGGREPCLDRSSQTFL